MQRPISGTQTSHAMQLLMRMTKAGVNKQAEEDSETVTPAVLEKSCVPVVTRLSGGRAWQHAQV